MSVEADAPFAGRIDAHHHLWRYADGYCGWMADASPLLKRDYLREDLARVMERCGVNGTIVVQAAETPVETDWLIDLAADTPFILGVVGWVDPTDAGAVARADSWRATGWLAGIRLWNQDDVDGERLRQTAGSSLLGWAADHDVPIDLLIRPRHLAAAAEVVDRADGVHFVVDHAAKPDIARWRPGDTDFAAWRSGMAQLAGYGNTACKLSGLVTEAAADWSVVDIRPYTDALLELFGPDRLLWGSDWPVALPASSYQHWVDCTGALLVSVSPTDRAAIFGDNAARIYGVRAVEG